MPTTPAFLGVDLDSREAVREASVRMLQSTLLFAVLLVVPVGVAFGLKAQMGAGVVIGFLLPLCAWAGLYWKSRNVVCAMCCCTPVVFLIFSSGAASFYTTEKPRFECICDPSCQTLPTMWGPGGGGRFGGGGAATDPWALRNESFYQNLCAKGVSSVESIYGVYAAIGAIAFALQFLACASSRTIMRVWKEQGTTFTGGEYDIPRVPQVYIPTAAAAAVPVYPQPYVGAPQGAAPYPFAAGYAAASGPSGKSDPRALVV